jgi:HlyD family secretion protein
MASSKRKWWIIGLILAVIALTALAVMKSKSKPKGKEITSDKVEKRTIVERVTASGKIFPETEVKISSDVSGEIVELYVEEGDSIIAGQLLAKIDPDTYLSAVERGQASVNNAKANLAMAESQIENSVAQKENIIAQLKNAERIHERNIELKKNGVISEAEFEQSLSSLEGLQANLRASEASLKSAQKSAEGAKYTIRSAEASLKEFKTSLRRTTITSPTSGTVSSLSVEQGERVVGTIQMTGTEMMRIANLNNMEVQVEVSENDILRVALNDSVDIEVDAYVDKKFQGFVTEIANSAANITSGAQATINTDQVTNFIVKVRIDPKSFSSVSDNGKKFPFRPGMSATVDIFTEKENNVLTLPIQAVTVRDLDKDDKEENFDEVVFVIRNDTARMVKVSTGIQDDEYIAVTSGLQGDEEVVSGPYSTLSKTLEDGELIRRKKENEEKKK